jgi:hypothetical protein
MRNPIRLLVLASALSLAAGTLSAQTRTPPTKEEIDARREHARTAAEARKTQGQARTEQNKEQIEARREAAKAAAQARREAGPRDPSKTRPTDTPRKEAAEARKALAQEYADLRRELAADVKAGTIDRAAAEAKLEAWRAAHPRSGG